MSTNVKYSIIIPVNNVFQYLPSTINSIISQEYDDYELIISDDNSTDGTAEYIDTLSHKNIIVLHTPERLTVAEHFDWALTHASGNWCMFVGGDDGLQPYFFALADRLIKIAIKKNIRAIASKRAYFFWDGCQKNYGNTAVDYKANEKVIIKDCKKEMLRVLQGKTHDFYFELPQMYTTSIFHSSLISEARQKQHGKFLTYGVTDSNLAAISTSLETRYLYSHIPLGWVGTSPKVLKRPESFLNSVNIHKRCGNYRLGYPQVYFWGALLTINTINTQLNQQLTNSQFINTFAAHIYNSIKTKKNFPDIEEYKYFVEFIKINNCALDKIIKESNYQNFKRQIKTKLFKILIFPWRCFRYVLKHTAVIKNCFLKTYSVSITWDNQPNMTMQNASELVMDLINKNINFEDISI